MFSDLTPSDFTARQNASRRPVYLLVMGFINVIGWVFSLFVLNAIPLIHWIVNGTFAVLTAVTVLLALRPRTLPFFEVVVGVVINFAMLSTVFVGLYDHPKTYDPLEYVLFVPAAYIAAFSFLGVLRGTVVCLSVFLATLVLTLGHYLPQLDTLSAFELQAFKILKLHYITSMVEILGLYGLTTFLERQLKARIQAESTARYAFIDTLTGLSNRRMFQHRLEQTLQHASEKHTGFALMFIDLDHFKQVNDRYGHQAGDELLQQISGRLSQNLRRTDLLARISGDEFAVIAEGITDDQSALTLAEKLISSLSERFDLTGTALHASASIGVSLYPHHGSTAKELLAHADQAMYDSKSKGRHACTLYSPDRSGPEQALSC
ncbi:GGDEF domain-containing protein [Deinococcus cellulosilyticus]|uniref:GGDEF domain-containing protein n=1 Tax=Deinococcus cellulosilyticus (strain DSM 18568 / NBRC 106333 / KACC 11606 / 5516J-15) TaxID=1223518 RepID=A0A511MXX4_DEIC1|nr:GGDEF domain-containing protein [Deinococcus cellulosilyticus]GEM44986.1 hypothetical protein DC3_06210 [Deinococcus cellulosilyticus NBRC 106333 = KACC 11606]